MKVISIGTDRKIFENGSAARQRTVEYGNLFGELHIVIFTLKNLNIKEERISENVFIYPTNSSNRAAYIFDAYKISKNILSGKSFDSVVSTQDPFETGLVGTLLKLRFGLPLHVQIHTDFLNKHFLKHSPLNMIRVLLAHMIIPFADRVRVVSKKIKDSVAELSSDSKIDLLPIYVSTETRSDNAQKNDELTILTIGRLEREKGVDVGIRAFAKIIQEGIKARYLIVGDGSERVALEGLAKELKVDKYIDFVGWQNELAPFYSKSHIYLSTSLYEGYGMTLVEAASYGLALVMTNTGLAGDIFVHEQSALVCEVKDDKSVADALTRLAKDKVARGELGSKALQAVSDRSKTLGKYLESYKDSIELSSQGFKRQSFVGRLWQLMSSVINHNKIVRYAVGGVSVALTQLLLLYVLTDFAHVWYLLSSIISFCYAVVTSFLIQKFWAFRDKSMQSAFKQFVQFILVALIGIAINTISMYFWVELIHIWYVLAQFVTGFIIMFVNFTIYKYVIFKNVPR
jgi:glycosyltransferase involved in cell wall biosynthesis/putative flippase GtrA